MMSTIILVRLHVQPFTSRPVGEQRIHADTDAGIERRPSHGALSIGVFPWQARDG